FCTRFGTRAIRTGLAVAARGGRVVLYQSIPDDDELSLNANVVHYREIEVIGTIAQSAADVAAAVETLADYHLRFQVLRTEIMPASRPHDAFERALHPHVNRVLIDLRTPFGV